MDGWVGYVGWPIADVWPTKKVIIRPASSLAQDRESSPVKDQRSTTVLRRQGFVCVCSVCLCVCPHDKTKTAETTITKLATGLVHHEFSSIN